MATLPNDCEKRCHSSLTPAQKQELCANYDVDYSLGPAICSVAAKDKLHLTYKDMLRLCYGAYSDGPVDCMTSLQMNQRNAIGYSLCKQANSALPANCYQELTSSQFSSGSQKNANYREQVTSFCQRLLDPAPLYCIQASMKYTKLTIIQAMSLCKSSVGAGSNSHPPSSNKAIEDLIAEDPMNTLSAACIRSMSQHIQPSLGITADMIVKFCVEIDPYHFHSVSSALPLDLAFAFQSFSSDCYAALTTQSQEDRGISDLVKAKDRLEICSNAPNALGPVNCTLQLFHRLKTKEPRLKIVASDVRSLCQRATSQQPSDCFLESFSLGNTSFRAHLCHAAENAGPAHCYRKIQSVFRNDEEHRLLLCIGALSEGPAACASEAPHYLANDEKVHLCADAPVSQSRDPIQCLQVVSTVSKQFHKAPKKVLGYFQANLQTDEEWTSRGLLISLCSFSDSQHPLAAAECLKSSPSSLFHDDAVRMCTNVSSVEVIQHLQLCQRLIPKSWSSEAIARLCERGESKEQVESIVRCAMAATRLSPLSLSSLEIARVCSNEQAQSEEVLSCLRAIAQGIRSVPSSLLTITSETVLQTCQTSSNSSRTTNRGQCLMEVLQSFASSHLSLQSDEVPLTICRAKGADRYRFFLNCLLARHRKLITLAEVHSCLSEPRRVQSMRIKEFWNEDSGSREIIAGRRFSLVLELLDQYNQLFQQTETDTEERPLFKISINENNFQGAILWGNRLNSSHSSGRLFLQHLVISQPGKVDIRISQLSPAFFSPHYHHHSHHSQGQGELLMSFQVTVLEDPRMIQTRPCLFVFTHNHCPADHDSEGQDYDSLFPMTRLVLAPRYYLANILCSSPSSSTDNEEEEEASSSSSALERMKVSAHLSAVDGSLWIEYKLGLDSIWTGIGLPTLEMPPLLRLQVTLPAPNPEELEESRRKKTLKLIKRGYYRASLQWHPDRWMAYDQYYQAAIAAIFPLITQAYEQLCQQFGEEKE